MTNTGWIGTGAELHHVLATVGADQDADGHFCVDGAITSFMGAGEEFVVEAEALYYINGQPRNLVAALRATSYGRSVVVIA